MKEYFKKKERTHITNGIHEMEMSSKLWVRNEEIRLRLNM